MIVVYTRGVSQGKGLKNDHALNLIHVYPTQQTEHFNQER